MDFGALFFRSAILKFERSSSRTFAISFRLQIGREIYHCALGKQDGLLVADHFPGLWIPRRAVHETAESSLSADSLMMTAEAMA